jgi:hypothetical protein
MGWPLRLKRIDLLDVVPWSIEIMKFLSFFITN